MTRILKGCVCFKSGRNKDRFPEGLTVADDKEYNEFKRVDGGIEFKNWASRKVLFVPMSHVNYYEAY